MWRKFILIAMLVTPLVLISMGGSEAQIQKTRVDLTSKPHVTQEDIISGLTPSVQATRTRGIATRTRGIQTGLSTIALKIHFDFDSASILPEAEPMLRNLGQALQSPQLAPYRIQIEGHTDSIGSLGYNQDLSQRRAESVKLYLTQNFGIVPDRLVAVGRGEAEPVHDNRLPQGREKNRRAEFVNLGLQ
jgi:outer membrane protein OmpA-like peptidoglycan-associated protein